MLVVRCTLLALLGLWSMRALLLYGVASVLLLHVLNFFDAFHHTFEQFVVDADEPLPMQGRDRQFEQDNTYSNLISRRISWLNLLTLNFGYHNAHHHRPSAPWYRLPALHRDLYGDEAPAVLPLAELLRTWHRNRVRRVLSDDYGAPGQGPRPRRRVRRCARRVVFDGDLSCTVPSQSLSGLCAVVTGAAGGIGSAISRQLIAQGATVHGLDLDAEGLRRLGAGVRRVHILVVCRWIWATAPRVDRNLERIARSSWSGAAMFSSTTRESPG